MEDSLLHMGGRLLPRLKQPTTVTALWERVQPDFASFGAFCFALDFLFCVGLVYLDPVTNLLARKKGGIDDQVHIRI